jgi:predicted MFS family arabinose efflux permease
LAVLTLSIPLSSTVGLVVGGLMGQHFGWRVTFISIGVAGLLLAPLVLVLLGAQQQVTKRAGTNNASLTGSLHLLKKRSYRAIIAGSASIAVAGYTLGTFAPAYLMRVKGMTVGEVGVRYGPIVGVVGVIGVLIVARIADRLSLRDSRWMVWSVAAMIFILLPCSTMAFLVESANSAIWLIALCSIIGTAWMGPTIAAIQRLAPPEQRATASAILLFFTAIIGAVGPFIAGVISDALQPDMGAASLSIAMLVVPIMHLCAGICYLVAARSYRAELVREELVEPLQA